MRREKPHRFPVTFTPCALSSLAKEVPLEMSVKLSKRHLLALSPLILVLVTGIYALQTAPGHIKGATVEYRIYNVEADGTTKEAGRKTVFLSQNGNWSSIRKNSRGDIDQTLIADSNRAGVFLLDTADTATKLGNFAANTIAFRRSQYKNNSQFRGEVTFLGYNAYVEGLPDNDGEVITELTWIPFLKLPVKVVYLHEDGSQTVEVATSIDVTEPEEKKTKFPNHIAVTKDATEEVFRPGKGGEK